MFFNLALKIFQQIKTTHRLKPKSTSHHKLFAPKRFSNNTHKIVSEQKVSNRLDICNSDHYRLTAYEHKYT